MFRPFLALLAAGALYGQSSSGPAHKPPAKVDRALRDNMNAFYQAHVEGKFRQAEQYVAEDTKDFFYTANKPKYVSFEISRIEYNAKFTRAKATVICEQYIMMPGFTDKPMKVPIPSTWKLENGKWLWYVDQEALRASPFGTMKPGTGPATGPAPSAAPTPADMSAIMRGVKVDKGEVVLSAGGEGSERVSIANGLPGAVTVSIAGGIPGIEATLDRTSLKTGEKAVLTVRAKGNGAASGILNLRIAQTNQIIPIRVTVK